MAADGKLRDAVQRLVVGAGERALNSVVGRMESATDRLTDYARRAGGPALAGVAGGAASVQGAVRGGLAAGKDQLLDKAKEKGKELLRRSGGAQQRDTKVVNIVEHIDVGVPVDVAYNQWTQFTDFPKFMKKVESVEQESAEKLHWRAQIFWSHRTWDATIIEQVPDRRIVWKSKGQKGSVDGAITFHEVGPELTRVVLILEYHPQGFFEHTGNIWRAQGRRARLELKHFARHVMTRAILHPEEVTGWRGEIHDGQVTPARPEAEDAGARPEAEDAGARPVRPRTTRRAPVKRLTRRDRTGGEPASGGPTPRG